MTVLKTSQLRSDYQISRLIRGGWQLAGGHGDVDRKKVLKDMETFLDAGITTIDCADIYTGVETIIGDFIDDLRSRRGESIAEKVIVHTKLVPDLNLLPELGPQDVEKIIDRSLKRLKIDTIHLLQFFWWDMSLGQAIDVLGVLKKCQEKGKIAYLGVTNWDIEKMSHFTDAGFDLVSAQVQFSVLDRRPLNGLSDWMKLKKMQFFCYGVLAGGFLTVKWLGQPDPGFSFSNRSLVKYRLIIDEFGSWDLFQDLLQTLKIIGDKYNVSLSSIALRWVFDQPQVAAAIVGARYATNLSQTLELFKFDLDSEDHANICSIQAKASGPNGSVYDLESDRESRHGRIMKYNLNNLPQDNVSVRSNG